MWPISALIALMVSFCISVALPDLMLMTLSNAVKWAFLSFKVSDMVSPFSIEGAHSFNLR
jgi:hypothetical protein